MNGDQNFIPEIQQFIDEHYGELSFAPSHALMTTKDPIEISIEKENRRYFLPESVIDFKEPSKQVNLIFGVGGIGRAPAVADEIYLTFSLLGENYETVHQATTRLPAMNKDAREQALLDHEYHHAVFTISGTVPNFPLTQSGLLAMDIEFHLKHPGLMELLEKQIGVEGDNSRDPEKPAATFNSELSRVVVRMGSLEEL